MINSGDVTNQNVNHSYRVIIISDSGLRKTNISLKLINHQKDIDKTYLQDNDLNKSKHLLLINKKKEGAGIKHFKEASVFHDYYFLSVFNYFPNNS